MAEVMNIVGDVKGKTAIIIDDIIDTAGTITLAANALLEYGAKEVYTCCTHPVFSGPAIERIATPTFHRDGGDRHHPSFEGKTTGQGHRSFGGGVDR